MGATTTHYASFLILGGVAKEAGREGADGGATREQCRSNECTGSPSWAALKP